jgi:hypothetical protein
MEPITARLRIVCQWFALCDRPADGVITHPILDDVPCCTRCAEKLDMLTRLQVWA